MKLLKSLALIQFCSGLECWTCSNGQNCELKECPNDGQKWACQNEIRIHGSQMWTQKGCKQKQACENNQVMLYFSQSSL